MKRSIKVLALVLAASMLLSSCTSFNSIIWGKKYHVTKSTIKNTLLEDLKDPVNGVSIKSIDKDGVVTVDYKGKEYSCFKYLFWNGVNDFTKNNEKPKSAGVSYSSLDIPEEDQDDTKTCVKIYYVLVGAFLHQVYPDKSMKQSIKYAKTIIKGVANADTSIGYAGGKLEDKVPYTVVASESVIKGGSGMLMIQVIPIIEQKEKSSSSSDSDSGDSEE